MNIIKIICLIFLSGFTPIAAYEYELAVCAMFQNEDRFLKEWLEFNILIGVEHFYLYNNNSTDNYEKILKPYIDAGIVDCIDCDYPNEHISSYHPKVYNNCLEMVRGKVKWLMFIDIDEFLFPIKHYNLREFLKEYEEFGAVCANWVMFGTSNIDLIPGNQLMIEVLTMSCSSVNEHIKSIIQPDKVKTFAIHHVKEFYPPYFQVTADKIKFEGPFMPSGNVKKLQINHYWTRDNKFLYEIKIPRRLILDPVLGQEWILSEAETMNIEKNMAIQKYSTTLKKIIFN